MQRTVFLSRRPPHFFSYATFCDVCRLLAIRSDSNEREKRNEKWARHLPIGGAFFASSLHTAVMDKAVCTEYNPGMNGISPEYSVPVAARSDGVRTVQGLLMGGRSV